MLKIFLITFSGNTHRQVLFRHGYDNKIDPSSGSIFKLTAAGRMAIFV